MRSGNGDNTQPFSIPTLILLLISSVLVADEYFISYRSVIKDAIIYNETLYISRAMHKCRDLKVTNKALILPLSQESQSLHSILIQNQDRFIDYLGKTGLEISYTSTTHNSVNHSWTRLILKPQCFKVDFNDTFVTIAPLK